VPRILFVGDVHATPEELPDCEALFRLVRDVALKEHVDEICLLGDSYHTHGVIRAEVLAFWRRTFKAPFKMRALVGNHDYSGEGSDIHAMIAHEDQITVVDGPVRHRELLFMPYYSDREEFVRAANAEGGRTLICHQTFSGSKYENGFFAEDGVNPDLLSQETIISGHIHTPQSFGKVTYIGAPRWRTLSDANVERAIWLYEFNEDGRILKQKPFDTSKVCRPIRYVLDTPDEPFAGTLDPGCDWRVDVKGPADYVEARKVELSAAGARVRTFKVNTTTPKVRESEGISQAFRRFMGSYTAKHGTPAEQLSSMARERLDV
jgi:hypothetical protein